MKPRSLDELRRIAASVREPDPLPSDPANAGSPASATPDDPARPSPTLGG